MRTYNSIQNLLQTLAENPKVNKNTLKLYERRLAQDSKLTKQENPQSHFSSMFVPFDQTRNEVFLVHHKKANRWIAPGGHIDFGETPAETMMREFAEELQHKLTNELYSVFDITHKEINNPGDPCQKHYDIWHIVYISKQDFIWDKREFYEADWIPLKQAIKEVITEEYKDTLRKLTIT